MGQFIENLRRTIDGTAIYDSTGKYGKPELNSFKTADEKLEKFLLAEPTSAEDINDYVLFAKSLNALSNKKVYDKIKTLVAYNKYSKEEISVALKIFQEKKREKILTKIIGVLLPLVLCVVWYVFFVHSWGIFWKVLWFIYGTGLCFVVVAALMNSLLGYDIYDRDSKSNPFR